ncbi:hypothetical protein EFBL_3078 [Effusibacillus lacus]|uniref:Uncharacterized protein n=1 Tax=Effusibacillus lacus TaxID=1348429 RepID=A0A292YR67_9BACL|nr:hypothetical protein EFBL_3078 [Effusibacillus lacus]
MYFCTNAEHSLSYGRECFCVKKEEQAKPVPAPIRSGGFYFHWGAGGCRLMETERLLLLLQKIEALTISFVRKPDIIDMETGPTLQFKRFV